MLAKWMFLFAPLAIRVLVFPLWAFVCSVPVFVASVATRSFLLRGIVVPRRIVGVYSVVVIISSGLVIAAVVPWLIISSLVVIVVVTIVVIVAIVVVVLVVIALVVSVRISLAFVFQVRLMPNSASHEETYRRVPLTISSFVFEVDGVG